MYRCSKIVFTLLLFCSISLSYLYGGAIACSSIKIGIVDIPKIGTNSYKVQKLMKKFDASHKEAAKNLEKLQKEYTTLEKSIRTDSESLKNTRDMSVFNKLKNDIFKNEKILIDKNRDMFSHKEEWQKTVSKYGKEEQEIQNDIFKIIKKYANKNKFNIVFDAKDILYEDDNIIDITNDIIKLLKY